MNSILVVLAGEDSNEELLSAANTHVKGTNIDVVLCKFVDRKEFQDSVQQTSNPGEQVESIDMKKKEAEETARTMGQHAFDDEVSYSPTGVVGSAPEDIIKLADENDSGHIFVAGKKRSPSGKALFGDLAQSVILHFDGPVTVITE